MIITNKDNTKNQELSLSKATVEVYSTKVTNIASEHDHMELLGKYKVPDDKTGTVWHAVELDTAKGIVREINKVSHISTPKNVPFNE